MRAFAQCTCAQSGSRSLGTKKEKKKKARDPERQERCADDAQMGVAVTVRVFILSHFFLFSLGAVENRRKKKKSITLTEIKLHSFF